VKTGNRQQAVGNSSRRQVFGFALWTLLFALCYSIEAQQPTKISRIGYLNPSNVTSARIETFRRGLRELGYVEGKNIAIEYRSADSKLERFSDLAAELVSLKVDVIFAVSTPAVLAAKNATKTIPIIFTNIGDPVAAGVVASLARPGGNITGLLSPQSLAEKG
jgi:ABC-type uncharacterized transport system substrate-binding protein